MNLHTNVSKHKLNYQAKVYVSKKMPAPRSIYGIFYLYFLLSKNSVSVLS